MSVLSLKEIDELRAKGVSDEIIEKMMTAPKPQTMKVELARRPHELGDADLIRAFAGARDAEIEDAARLRFGDLPVLVMTDDWKADADKSVERHQERDTAPVYEGCIVATVDEALDHSPEADPLDGSKLRKGLKAQDGVRWPKEAEARMFVWFCAAKGLGGLGRYASTQDRAQMADSLKAWPAVPSYLEDALVLFKRARTRGELTESVLRYQPKPRAVPPAPPSGDLSASTSAPGTVRRRLESMPSSDFDAFVLDNWSHVYRQFSSGMDKAQRTNLLLVHVDRDTVSAQLKAIGR